MDIRDVYEKYKHLDKTIIDPFWMDGEFAGRMIYDLWNAVKEEVGRQYGIK